MFTGNKNQQVTLTDAGVLTKAYRDANPGQILGLYFSKSILQDILAQSNCVGMRAYYALDSDGSKQMVLTGVTADGNDLCNGVLGDPTPGTPPYSGTANALNS